MEFWIEFYNMPDIIAFTLVSIFVVGMIMSTILVLVWINVTFFDNIPTKVYVGSELVYDGSSAGVEVDSSGYATTVKLHRGFLYMFPYRIYTSKNITIEGMK